MDSLPAQPGTETGRPIALRFGEFAEALRADAIPPDVMEQAKRHMLDCLGIALASSGSEFGPRPDVAALTDALAG